jgi:Xaa-Pro aminopeptidase
LSFTREPDGFEELAGHCANVTPIGKSEFLSRQQNLAETLYSLNASALIVEPGPSARYYANVSSWGLSERPLLLIISPQLSQDGASVKPNVSILTPHFEKTRAQLMAIPSADPLTYVSWREEINPYETAITAIPSFNPGRPIFVEGELRAFILDGLSKASPSTPVLAAPLEIQRLRQRKSRKEIEIMKCVNEVRQMLSCVKPDFNCS